jgi:hypothetical protein
MRLHIGIAASLIPLSVAPIAQPTPVGGSAAVTSGVATYAADPAESDNVNAAIDRSVRRMGWLSRPVARHRLRLNNPQPAALRLTWLPDTIIVALGRDEPLALPRDGTTVPWRDPEGEVVHASLAIHGDTLTQAVIGKDGRADSQFLIGDDGRHVLMSVTITSPHLPDPVVYSIGFRQTSDTR